MADLNSQIWWGAQHLYVVNIFRSYVHADNDCKSERWYRENIEYADEM